MKSLRSFPILVLLLLTGGVALAFAPGEQVWCNVCRDYADAPHSDSHRGDTPGFGYCAKCEGFFPGVETAEHVHIADKTIRPDKQQGRQGESQADASGSAGHLDSPDGNDGQDERFDPSKIPLWVWIVPAGLFALFLLVSLLAHSRPKKKGFQFVGGVPQGITLRKGTLVCAEDGAFDGGTSQVYEAMFNDGRRWQPAFVKRIIGKGMRDDQRFPMIQFEADVLRRLEPTGAVPHVLIEPETVALSDGSRWSYYAMSAAQGAPWPEHGGLGSDTRPALASLCEGLMRLHDLGIGHHDLKPQNIFWDSRRKRITLLDFGSAIDHSPGADALVNPIGGTMTGTRPWMPPASDGKVLMDLSPLSDNWVYGLIFCEALVGGVHAADRTQRRTPEKPEDRDWFREELGKATSPSIADAVVDGLFALEKSRRMKLQEFLALLRKEWEV